MHSPEKTKIRAHPIRAKSEYRSPPPEPNDPPLKRATKKAKRLTAISDLVVSDCSETFSIRPPSLTDERRCLRE